MGRTPKEATMNVEPTTKHALIAAIITALLMTAVLLQSLSAHADEMSALTAPASVLYVCPSGCAYSSIQDAVDAASSGDTIKVASGTYTGVQARPAPPGYDGSSVITQTVYISQAITIQGGYTTTNWITPDPDANPTRLDAQRQGRVIFVTGDITPTVEGLRITRGDADGLGGHPWGADTDAGAGVYVISATITIRECHITHNETRDFGGGVFLWDSPAELSDNTISNNQADGGGGLYLWDSDATISGNTITDNEGGIEGGGLHLHSNSAATISGNTITFNAGFIGGGILLADSDATLSGNTISSNTAESGGGLYLDHSSATLSGNTISANAVAEGSTGSAVLLYYSPVRLISNTITANYECEGTIFADHSSGATLDGNSITSNAGEGVYFAATSATLDNNVIADNTAAGLSIVGSNVRLRHNTIARNGSGGLYVGNEEMVYSTVTLTNTILVSHAVGIYVLGGNTATLEATLWANDTDWDGAGTIITGTVNLWGAPAFVSPDAGDYHVGPTSTAIDKGVDAGVDYDVDGDPRPIGTGSDIGADEFPAALSVTKEASPAFVQAGGQLVYTIRVTNTGIITATATVTDTLPDHVTPTGVITWTPTITAPGGIWTQTFVVTAHTDYAGPLTNVVRVTSEEGAAGAYTETATAHLPLPTPGDVLINEIAWSGTNASSEHEWMELRNTRPYALDLDTCVLAAQDGTPTIPLAGAIAPHGYSLLERDATATNVPHDLLYAGALDDDGEHLTLTCDSTIVDQVDASTGWPAGHDGDGDPPYATMERHTQPADSWHTNDGVHRNGLGANGQPINGTPRAPNSPAWSLALTVDQITAAYPGDVVAFTHTLSNTGGITDTYTLTVETKATGDQVHPVTATLPAFEHTNVHVTVTVPITAPTHTTYVVTLTVRSWNSPTLSATNVDTLTVLCRTLTDVDISGPLTGTTGTPYAFTVSISPGTATPPITYTWSPTPTAGQGTTTTTYTWAVIGVHTITVTAENYCGGPVTDTHTITITISPPPPIYLPFIVCNWPPIHHIEDAPDACPGYGPLNLAPHQYREDFDHPWDKDWYTFAATADVTYTIRTSNLGSRADTVLYLYVAGCADPDPIWNDDCVEGDPPSGSCIFWRAPDSGDYHIFVRNYYWDLDYGPDTSYTLTVLENQ